MTTSRFRDLDRDLCLCTDLTTATSLPEGVLLKLFKSTLMIIDSFLFRVADYAFLDLVVGPALPVVTAPFPCLSFLSATVPSAPGSGRSFMAIKASRPVFLLGRPCLTSFL